MPGGVEGAEPLCVELSELQTLHDWMRAHGVSYARVGDLELELGPPPPTDEEPKVISTEDREAQHEAERERRFATLYGVPR